MFGHQLLDALKRRDGCHGDYYERDYAGVGEAEGRGVCVLTCDGDGRYDLRRHAFDGGERAGQGGGDDALDLALGQTGADGGGSDAGSETLAETAVDDCERKCISTAPF